MRRTRLMTGMLLLGIVLMIYGTPAVAGDILEFDMMAGVPEDEFAIRDINGGGAPWVVDVAKGSLSEDGDLEITVRGLVLLRTGLNPSETFSGVVSCIVNGDVFANISTAPVLTGPEGDADIEEKLILPNPCFAPIVLVVGASGNWFAVTGGGPEEELVEMEEPEDEDEVEDEKD
jgi:hypothetical protein